MGADYFFLRGCRLQSRLGPDAFVHALKQRVRVHALESMREQIEAQTGRALEDTTVRLGAAGTQPDATTFAELKREAAVLADTEECAACSLARGRPLGCYAYVRYPVDKAFERRFFAYFVEALQTADPAFAVGTDPAGKSFSAASLVKQIVIDNLADGDAWVAQRGPAETGGLAELTEPLSIRLGSGETLDSARVLRAAFAPVIDGLEALLLYAHLFDGFFHYLEREGADVESATVEDVRQVAELLRLAAPLARAGELTLLIDS
jgi:hypothetical protein